MTTPTRPGGEFSARVEAKVVEYEGSIGRFAADRGLPNPLPRSIDDYINMSRSELRAMSGEDVAEAAWEVATYAYYLQDQSDKVQVRVQKLDHEINKIAFPAQHGYDAYKTEDKVLLATLDDRLARELHELRAVALGYQARWNKLGYLLSDIARKLDTVIIERRKSRG